MSIKSVSLENFTVFEKIDIEFSSGINVIIGENGTGKTHLIKLMYANKMISQNENLTLNDYFKGDTMRKGLLILEKLERMPLVELDKTELENIESSIISKTEKDTYFRDTVKQSLLEMVDNRIIKITVEGKVNNLVFIPAKEMLTHSKGFMSMYDKFDMPFDKTYYDIISKSLLPNLKEIPHIGKAILPKLEDIIGGKVIIENDTFFIQKSDDSKIEFYLEAEGIKKIAIIWQLLMNENITKDTVLFWDEPESNINPKLIPDVVEMLLELSRQGVQIFVATHNYIFAKYMEVLMTNTDDVSCHALYKTENDGVKCETNKNFRDLKENSIISSFDKLLDQVFDADLGD